MKFSAVQNSALQFSAVQYSTVQCSAVWCGAVLGKGITSCFWARKVYLVEEEKIIIISVLQVTVLQGKL